jgi:uncharacterized protein (TIGR02284 family)
MEQLGNNAKDKPEDSEPGIWMDIKTSFISNDLKSIFNTCEHYENLILHSYEKALLSKEDINEDIHQLIANQKEKIVTAHKIIRKHKDTITF